jgi:NAD+ kinase
MKVAIHGRQFDEDTRPYIKEVFSELGNHNAKIQISKKFHKDLRSAGILNGDLPIYNPENPDEIPDFFISLGGDGTLLETITYIGPKEIPILGINMGRLGFLATTPKQNIPEAISAIRKSRFKVEGRSLIKLDSNQDIFNNQSYALNEFAILKKDSSAMIVVHTYIDGEYLNSYWSDGLIVSTPTGSTGYSLSCGGPVVLPTSNNFIITPISPHNLNVRPMIVSDESVISFEIEGRSKNFLVSLDSRSCTVDETIQMAVKKENFKVNLVKLDGYNFLNTLRQKLNWGLDLRN